MSGRAPRKSEWGDVGKGLFFLSPWMFGYLVFTITPILFLEDLGFCPKGEGGRFVSDGAIAPGGKLPVNTSGGGLSYCHPGMYGLLVMIEAIRQVRGECGERQVPDCNFVHYTSDVAGKAVSIIYGK